MFTHHIMSSSDEEEAVIPLKLIRSNLMLPEPPEDPNSYEELYKYSMEKCEFCESIFHNRYDVIIHNAEHIIVPLINQTTFKCANCLHVFTSEQELYHHMYIKHNIATAPRVLERFIGKNSLLNKKVITAPKVLHNFISKELTATFEPAAPKVMARFTRKEPVVKCDDSIAVGSAKHEPTVPRVLSSFPRSEPVVTCDDSVATLVKSKSRLVFEDEDNDIICLDAEEPSRTNGHYVNTSVNNLILDIMNNKLEATLNGVTHNNQTEKVTPILDIPFQVKLDTLTPSIHFEQLVKPGLYRCRRCTMTFPNRYAHIVHETGHMRFQKQVRSCLCMLCDRHIAGNHHNLHNHIEANHPYADLTRRRVVSLCSRCNLRYHNTMRHSLLYHYIYLCSCCRKRFDNQTVLETHLEECKNSLDITKDALPENSLQRSSMKPDLVEDKPVIMKVCEVCALFFKDRQNFKYICVGENSELQCNQVCERCNKEAYVIKLIKRVRINMKIGGQCKVRILSNNENRLKNIQQRLKLMNKLSRF